MMEQVVEQNAVYNPEGLPSFALGNPLCEALPKVVLGQDLIEALARKPAGDFSRAGQPSTGDFMELSSLCDINLPRPESTLLLMRCFSMLCNSYSRRPPFRVETQQQLNTIDQASIQHASSLPLQVDALTVLGWSGMGKTTIVRSILKLLPSVIVHTQYGGITLFQKQVVYLSVDAPIGASPKGFLLSIATALDKALRLEGAASYAYQIGRGRLSVEEKCIVLARACASHYVGLLHIDDMQRLGEGSKTLCDQVSAMIIGLANTLGCALLFSGTPAALKVLQSNFEVSRRASRRGAMSLLAPQDEEDPFFTALVNYLFSFQLQKEPAVPTTELRKILLKLTAGIPGVLTSLYVAAQEMAVVNGLPLDGKLFARVMKEQFAMLMPALRKLNEARKRGGLSWDAAADKTVASFTASLKPKLSEGEA